MSLKDYISVKPTIETARYRLRPLRSSDAEFLKTWLTDPKLYVYWGKRAGKTDKNPELLFAAAPKPSKSFHWGIARKDSDEVVGELWVYLIENDRMGKVAFRVAPSEGGRGCATEALSAAIDFCFAETELKRLWTDVDIRNAASVRVLEKCGFRREGLIREGKMVSTYCDYYLYGLLRSDRE